MKKKILYIEQLENQIKNTVNVLQEKHLLYMYNDINKKKIDTNKWILSWDNHQTRE